MSTGFLGSHLHASFSCCRRGHASVVLDSNATPSMLKFAPPLTGLKRVED